MWAWRSPVLAGILGFHCSVFEDSGWECEDEFFSLRGHPVIIKFE